MEVNFDFAETALDQRAERVEEVRPIFFAGKEEAVARRPAVGIAELGQRRIAARPRVDARAAGGVVGVAMQRFVVIAQREQEVRVSARSRCARSPHQMARVIGQPLMKVLFAETGQHRSGGVRT